MQLNVVELEKTESTQTYAKENVQSFPQDRITCVVAKEQTNGHGRFTRKWSSKKGGLYFTLYFPLSKDQLHITCLAQVMTLSIAKVLQKKGLKPSVKWPNDVLLSGKKCAGVLCEISSNDASNIFLGVGLNVNNTDFGAVEKPATSLKNETGKDEDLKELLQLITQEFIQDLEIFKEQGFTPFHPQFENLMLNIGKKIVCFDGKKEWMGTCHSLTCDGQLNLCLENGEMKTISSGEICC